jgi:hypothetical protein
VEAATSLTQGERARIITQTQPISIIYRIIGNKAIQIDAAGNPDGIGSEPGAGNGVVLPEVVMIKPIFMIKASAGVAVRIVGEITLDDGSEGGVAVTNGLVVLVILILLKRANRTKPVMAGMFVQEFEAVVEIAYQFKAYIDQGALKHC